MSVYKNIWQNQIQEKYAEIESNVNKNNGTIFTMFYSVANTAFDWRNLPKGTLPFLPEEFLTYWAQIAYFIDDNGEAKIYPAFPSGKLLENGLYDSYTIIAKNGKQWQRKLSEIELCFCNSLRLPGIVILKEMVNKCSYALSCVDSTLERAMLGDILSCSSKEQLESVLALYDKEKSLAPFKVTANDGFKNDGVKRVPMFDGRERDIMAQWEVFTRYKNVYLTLYGVFNIEQQKGARLTEAESKGNEDIVRYSMMSDMWMQRKDFMKRVVNHFAHNLDIVPNRSVTIDGEDLEEDIEIAQRAKFGADWETGMGGTDNEKVD